MVSKSRARTDDGGAAGRRARAAGSFQRQSLHGRVAQEMGQQIVRGTLRPGDPLPIETQLSAQFGVSRPAVREAIKILAGKGLVQSRPKTGTRVRPRQDWNFLDADVLTWRLAVAPSAEIVRELFELRRVIEPAAAALAAARAPAPHLRRLRAAYEDMVTACDRESGYLEADMRVHRTILEAVNNEMLRSLATVVDTALSLSLRLSIDNLRGQRYSLPLHKTVLDAIANRSGVRARRAMLRLIEDAERDVRRVIRRRSVTTRGSGPRGT